MLRVPRSAASAPSQKAPCGETGHRQQTQGAGIWQQTG